jgi:lipid-binding SYLF domain-containing protein
MSLSKRAQFIGTLPAVENTGAALSAASPAPTRLIHELQSTRPKTRRGTIMRRLLMALAPALLVLGGTVALADDYSDTIDLYKKAGESAEFFKNCYGYAVFPSIAKGGLGIGAAHGDGRVYEQGKYVGDTSMTQVSIGAQAGGQAYSQMIFFENKAAFDQFTSGNFEFGAGVGAVAIKSSASGSVGTTGATASAASGGGESGAGTAGKYRKGMAVFTIAKGGAMFEASLAGQKYKYKAKGG